MFEINASTHFQEDSFSLLFNGGAAQKELNHVSFTFYADAEH